VVGDFGLRTQNRVNIDLEIGEKTQVSHKIFVCDGLHLGQDKTYDLISVGLVEL
jgi:hypothetical protein